VHHSVEKNSNLKRIRGWTVHTVRYILILNHKCSIYHSFDSFDSFDLFDSIYRKLKAILFFSFEFDKNCKIFNLFSSFAFDKNYFNVHLLMPTCFYLFSAEINFRDLRLLIIQFIYKKFLIDGFFPILILGPTFGVWALKAYFCRFDN
jgi:hypothetical protein